MTHPDLPVAIEVPLAVEAHVGMDAVRAALAGDLAGVVGAQRAAAWGVARARYRPVLWVAREGSAPVAAVLTTGRPATAATTLVDPWWASESAAALLVERIIEQARERGDVVLKWRSDGDVPVFAADAGFVPLREPLGFVGTSVSSAPAAAERGAVLWLEAFAHPEPGYYAQTTMFTCGAVAALTAAGLRAAPGFTATDGDRDVELAFWRSASNYPACEPVGLAVTTAEHLPSAAVEVALDADGPVLVEEYAGFDLSFRTELQAQSRHRAAQLGVPITSERVDVAEIARRVAGGELALLLIDEEPMHGEHGPHWVLAHASDGDDVVVIEDPWINRDSGETWVDTHELPVRLADLDRLVRWSDAGYRGVVFIR